MKDPDSAQRLIRLKRYESPGEEYFGSFLGQFQERQRSELLRRSSLEIFADRMSVWCDETFGQRWLLPVGATAAAAVVGAGLLFAMPSGESPSPPAGLADAAAPEAPETAAFALTADTDAEEETITLQLPRPSGRVPSFQQPGESGRTGILPVRDFQKFREL